jgi:4-hydroxythreonine-4-phosphate dehydrogenase
MKPLLAVTMGDPAGIGPEIVVKAMSNKSIFDRAQPFVIGAVETLKLAMQQTGIDLPMRSINAVADVEESSELQVLELQGLDCRGVKQGEVSSAAGHAAVQFFETAVKLALAGEIQGVVTGPINKEAVHAAGYHGDIGHQEILGRMTQSNLTATMLMTTGLKVAHLSTHKSLAQAVQFVRKDVLVERITLTANCLRQWTAREPKIAVAALNPHGGEGGLLGLEELDEIAPAVHQLRQQGLDVVGPYPADSVFYRAAAGEFDAVMALYHDQGHIAIKMHNFADSITATMGIPFIRTSVDHGTAFDIAGQNLANADGLGRAVDAAISMANQTL